jgi:hypothetical protein
MWPEGQKGSESLGPMSTVQAPAVLTSACVPYLGGPRSVWSAADQSTDQQDTGAILGTHPQVNPGVAAVT